MGVLSWRTPPQTLRANGYIFGLALCVVPLSIAVTEILLALALVIRITVLTRVRAKASTPRVFWFWLAWVSLELLSWLRSSDIPAGWGEIRHLLLLGAIFLLLPALDHARDRVVVWRGIFATATLNSTVIVWQVVSRVHYYRIHPSVSVDPIVYLRTGGLLHHWMIYGTVEVLVFAGLLEFWQLYPEERRWSLPFLIVNCLAICLSLTRMLWVCCWVLLALQLIWRRSKLVWVLPFVPVVLFILSPGFVRSRVTMSLSPSYYSNAERLQMLRVGWRMVIDKPLTGVGPGRVEKVYRQYLADTEPVPAYHGHLHNNLVQLAAEFGLPVAVAAILFVILLFRDLREQCRSAVGRERRFLCRTSVLALAGFLLAGMFDYTYGHSLGLILLSFVVLSPLVPVAPGHEPTR